MSILPPLTYFLTLEMLESCPSRSESNRPSLPAQSSVLRMISTCLDLNTLLPSRSSLSRKLSFPLLRVTIPKLTSALPFCSYCLFEGERKSEELIHPR